MYDIEKTWPKWKVVRLIGEGSFGKVFEIYRNEFGIEEHSALKVISIPQSDSEVQSLKNDGMTDRDTTEYFKGIVSDFVQEIQLMSQLKGNTNVVAYEDFAVIEKEKALGFEILIRMELLTALPAYLRENRFRVMDVLRLGIDICKALEVCRELNIVHRDIKPDNIFVSANGSYKLGDFGVARTIEKTMAGLSRKGTYSYMAPEIYNGQEYGFEADIYSLGVVLYKLLNNNRDPFLPAYPAPVRYNDKTEAMVKRIQGLPFPKPEYADEKLSQIIFKACAHNPADRYRQPLELRADLEAMAIGYQQLQSEVFSENDINRYTNNSVFSTMTGDGVLPEPAVQNDGTTVGEEPGEEGTAIMEEPEEEGTAIMEEPEEEGTVIMEEPEDQGTMVMTEANAKNEEQSSDIEDKKDSLVGVALPNGFWRCVCGRTNAAYVSSCTCGVNKREIAWVREDPETRQSKEPALVKGDWICSCGRANAKYVSSCVCGVNKRELIIAESATKARSKESAGASEEEGQRPGSHLVTKISRTQCPVCQKEVKEGSFFCGNCGHDLAEASPQTRRCLCCGAVIRSGTKFCGNCGAKL